jgi:sugar lactone lactonase YvrE
MKILDVTLTRLTRLFCFVVLLSACSQSGMAVSYEPAMVTSSSAHSKNSGDVYVANGNNTVTVYSPEGKTLLATITRGLNNPTVMAMDRSGNLYVGNNGFSTSGHRASVVEYPPGQKTPSRTLTDSVRMPFAIVTDTADNFYVANANYPTVTVYGPTGTKPLRVIRHGIRGPVSLAIDTNNTLYVANDFSPGNVAVYPAGSSTPSLVLRKGMGYPDAVAVDSQANVYVGDLANRGSLKEYPAGSTQQGASTQKRVKQPRQLLADVGGTIYAVNLYNVSVYQQQTLQLVQTITNGLTDPNAIALSQSKLLYVADIGSNTVPIYRPAASKPFRIISDGIYDPQFIVIAP